MHDWLSVHSPWVHHVESGAAGIEASVRLAFRVFELDGSLMQSPVEVFSEFSRKFSFPDYFGENWAALEDCLYDLNWLPAADGYLLVVRDWGMVLNNSPSALPVLVRILGDAGYSWSQYPGGGKAFNSLLVA
ncbi:barstar family protein [Streptomyces zhihengii]|uniref:Barstar family protein n=1 Tax=Streptomyces zhihengii TaxID=1818004 RepID=A0ABS2V5A7_9ACTN|nr:barstar family protein [Streptomyces zhihengii]MBM9624824.1 barstar family protein [Streptomyces zhihengii]